MNDRNTHVTTPWDTRTRTVDEEEAPHTFPDLHRPWLRRLADGEAFVHAACWIGGMFEDALAGEVWTVAYLDARGWVAGRGEDGGGEDK
jgi:hypothetical protein